MKANSTAQIAREKIVRYRERGRQGTGSFLVKQYNGWSRADLEYFLRTDQTNACRNYKSIRELWWGRRRPK